MHSLFSKRTAWSSRLQTCVLAGLAVCSAVALSLLLPTNAALHERTNSAVWVFCAVGLFYLLRHAAQAVSTRGGRLYFSGFGLLISFVYTLGRYIYLYHAVKNVFAVLAIALLLTPATAALLATAAGFFNRSANCPAGSDDPLRRGFFDGRRHLFGIVFLCMLLCYLPCFLAFFPANVNYDIANQTQQAVTGVFSANHPLAHTLLIKACLNAGLALLGSYTNGFALYAALQTLLLVGCFAYSFCCIVRLTPNRSGLHWAALLFFLLYPSNHLFAVTTTKDVLAAGALLVSLCAFALLLFEARPLRAELARIVLFVISSVFAMLLRNGAVSTYLVLALVLLLAVKRLRFRLLLPTLIAIAAFYASSAGLKAACHASDSSPVELLSVPIQQMVNASIEHPECFTEEEQVLFDALIETNKRYLPHISDPIKEFIDKDVLLDRTADYWALYRSIGKKAPDSYLNAFLILNLGIWYPDEITHADVHTNGQGYLHTSDWYFGWDRAAVAVEKHSYLPAVESFYNLFAQKNLHQKIPIVSMLFSPGFACQLLFVLAILLLYRRDGRSLLVFIPLLVYWVGLLFAPCIYIRYVYPIIVCIPLLSALTLRTYSKSSAAEGTAAHEAEQPAKSGKGTEL